MAAPARIAYLVSRYPAVNHTFILREIVALRSLGWGVDVIAIRGDDRPLGALTNLEKLEHQKTFTVLPVGFHFLWSQLATFLSRPLGYLNGLLTALALSQWNLKLAISHLAYFAEAVVAGREIQRRGIRHMHCHFSSTVGLLAARVFKIGLSITIHGPDEFNDVIGFHMREKVEQSRFIVTISNFARSQVLRATDPEEWTKVEVCRLGVDPNVFCPGPPRSGDSPLNVIFVGRLAPVKAPQLLIAACSHLILNGGNLRLRLVGSGPDRERLEKFASECGIQDRVIFEGPRNQDEVLNFYRESDVFALASFAEGVPVVLMEAMGVELPCVSTWVNGIPELIEHENSGLLVPPADERQLASALQRLIDDPALRRRLGKRGREQVMSAYNLETNTALLSEILRRRLEGSL